MTERIVHDLIQGSPEWEEFRLTHNGASEAAAMMGLSRHVKRSELLRAKHTGNAREFSAWVQEHILDRGHEIEALARPFVEELIGEMLYPVTMSLGKLSASCDGLTLDDVTAWECKSWNAELAKSVAAGVLPEEHQPQCYQVLHVTGAKRLIFTVSDGTRENTINLEVLLPNQATAISIEKNWAQFDEDLANYQYAEVIQAAKAAPQMALPAVSVLVQGSIAIRDNLGAFGESLNAYLSGVNKKPQTDQDFADLDAAVKTLKAAEEALDAAENSALAQTESVDLMRRTVALHRETARSNRLLFEKLVKSEKDNRRETIRRGGADAYQAHLQKLNERLGSYLMTPATSPQPNFLGVMKGLKTLASIQDAVDTELARVKIEANAIADRAQVNLALLAQHVEHNFLFVDVAQIVFKATDDFAVLVKSRIADHKIAEEKRLRENAAINAKLPSSLHDAVPAISPRPAVGGSDALLRPSDEMIISCLSLHFRVHESKVIEWLLEIDLNAATARMMQEFPQ